MSFLKLLSNTKKVVKSFETNKKSISTAAGASVFGLIGVAGIKVFYYLITEKNEDESAELQRKTEENNYKIWLWSFSAVVIELLIIFLF